MKNLAQTFIDIVKSKGHLTELIKNASLSLWIQTDQDSVALVFERGEISLYPEGINHYDVTISGSKYSIQALMIGTRKLREAIVENEISIKATFRNILLLESVFYLSRIRDELISKEIENSE